MAGRDQPKLTPTTRRGASRDTRRSHAPEYDGRLSP
nr:MAG TPA: hypothetical protein [Bacteriophage sp.]